MKKSTNNKCYYIIIIAIIVLVITAILIIAFKDDKNFDLDKVKEQFLSYYIDDDIHEIEKDNIDYYFAIPSGEIDSALLLSNFDPNDIDDENDSLRLIFLIPNIGIEKVDEYYDSLDGFVYAHINNNNLSKKEINLYKNAILKRGKSYVYLILGKDNKIMEQELLRLYK